MRKVKNFRMLFGIIAILLALTAFSHAQNNLDVYLNQFEEGKKQAVSVYDIDSLTIARGGVTFKMGKGQVVLLNYGWDKPSAMICHAPGEFIYTPPDKVETQQLKKLKDVTRFENTISDAVFFFTVPLHNILTGEPVSREITGDEWDKISDVAGDALTHLLLYLPNKLLDDLMSSSIGNFLYADFQMSDIGHTIYIEDPTQDDWYRIYEIKRSAGTLTSDVLAGFSPYDRPPAERGVMPIDIYHYDIDSRIESDGDMEVTCRINFHPILQGRQFIYLNWYKDNELIKAIDSDGNPIKVVTKKEDYSIFDVHRRESGIGLILNKPMTVGDSDFVEISYRCNTLAKKSTLFYIRSETEWYPKTLFPDVATYTLSYNTPSRYQLISSGQLISLDETDGRAISKYEVEAPVEEVGFNIGKFKSKVMEVDGYSPVAIYLAKEIADLTPREFLEHSDTGLVNKPLDVYLAEKYEGRAGSIDDDYNRGIETDNRNYDGDMISGGSVKDVPDTEGIPMVSGRYIAQGDQDTLTTPFDTMTIVLTTSDKINQAGADITNSSIFFTSIFNYTPFDTIKVSSLPERRETRGAPGMVYLPWYSFVREDIEGKQESFRAQQVAYQWFGHTVKPKSYRDEWIINGLAKYCGMWYYEIASKDRKSMENGLDDMRDEIFHGKGLENWELVAGIEKRALGTGVKSVGSHAGSMTLDRRLNSVTYEDYRPVVHSKAAYIFHMIRYLLRDYQTGSDDLFASFLKDIVINFSDKPISNAGLQQLLEQYVGGDMSWFFDQWVYGTKYPKYEFSYEALMNKERKHIVRCTVKQFDVDENFRMIVPVTILFKDDKYSHMRMWVTLDEETIDLPPVPYKPKKVIFNTYDAVLCKVDYK